YDELLKDGPSDVNLLGEAAEYATLAGSLFREFGKNAEAEPRFTRAIDLYRQGIRSQGEEEKLMVSLADTLMRLGHLYRNTDRALKSEEAYREASEIALRL